MNSLSRILIGLSMALPIIAGAQSQWTLRYQGLNLEGVAWTGSQYVAVGRSGAVQTSPDAITWTPRSSGTSQHLWAVAWAGNLVVAVGDSGTLLTSPDGIAWTSRKMGTTENLTSVAWSGTKIVAVGTYDIIRVSIDGVNWTLHDTQIGSLLTSLVWTGWQWVAVGNDGMVTTSPDGMNWTPRGSGIGWDIRSITWSGSQHLAVGGGVIISSPNGLDWTSHGGDPHLHLRSVAWSGTQFVAIGDSALFPVLLTSPNGKDWTLRRSPSSLLGMNDIAFAGGQLIGVGSSGLVFTSPDGNTWTDLNSGAENFRSVIWTGKQLVAVGENIMTSTDGMTWASRSYGTDRDLVVHGLNSVVWTGAANGEGNGLLAAGGWRGDTILTSPDGITWTKRPTKSPDPILSMSWTGTQMAAVSEEGTIQTSPDGLEWTLRKSSPSSDALQSIHWANDSFVAVGYGNVVSSDGIFWSGGKARNDLMSVTWKGDKWVAVGKFGGIQTSPDGINWTTQTSGTTRDLNAVFWTGSKLIAVGDYSTILTSLDGDAWTPQPPLKEEYSLQSLAWTGTQLVLVGGWGIVLTSPQDPIPSYIMSPSKKSTQAQSQYPGLFPYPYSLTGRHLPALPGGKENQQRHRPIQK